MAEPSEESVARLRKIEGQVRGLQRMLADGRPYEEVITQFMATRAALDKVGIGLVSQHIQACTRRHGSGDRCEGELERALALFLRMESRPIVSPFEPRPTDDAIASPAPG